MPLLIIIVCLLGSGTALGEVGTSSSETYASILRCGPNSLYVFLLLLGFSAVTTEEMDNIPISSDGTSFLSLRDAARRFGVDAEIRRYRPEDVDWLPLPAIGQFVSAKSSLTPYHFNVIYKVDSARVYVIDGTTGDNRSYRRDKLSGYWTGCAMISKPRLGVVSAKLWSYLSGIGVLFLDVCILGYFVRRLRGKTLKSERIRALTAAGGIAIALTIPLSPLASLAATANDRTFTPWRCNANGGINALYCYLRTQGIKCNYYTLVRQQAEEVGAGWHTAATLAHLSGRQGAPLLPVSLTMDELKMCPLPILVHMDGESPQSGAFLLVFNIGNGTMAFVNGPSASIHEMSMQDFRRVWSGVALLPALPHWLDPLSGVAGLIVGLVSALFIRRRGCRFRILSQQLII